MHQFPFIYENRLCVLSLHLIKTQWTKLWDSHAGLKFWSKTNTTIESISEVSFISSVTLTTQSYKELCKHFICQMGKDHSSLYLHTSSIQRDMDKELLLGMVQLDTNMKVECFFDTFHNCWKEKTCRFQYISSVCQQFRIARVCAKLFCVLFV